MKSIAKNKTMQQHFTVEFMEDNRGCYDLEQLRSCSFMSATPITLELILRSEIKTKDKFWFVCHKLATKTEKQQIAIDLAELVLPIFEKRYPKDSRSREAIEAAKAFIAGTIGIDELLQKRRKAAYAAAATYTAAYAAAATYTAAATHAAAYAAAATHAAAYAAAYAYAAAAADAAAYADAAADADAAAAAYAYAAADADAAADDIQNKINNYLLKFLS